MEQQREGEPIAFILPKDRFDDLLRTLRARGYEAIGPKVEEGAIVYGPISSSQDLPIGWTDNQTPGSYLLVRRTDGVWFGFAVGPHSWKKYLFPPYFKLWQARREGSDWRIEDHLPAVPPRAFIGMRSCELHALAIQDRVFMNRGSGWSDPYYSAARRRLFLIAVECQYPGGTCFCASAGTGPGVDVARIPLLTWRHADARGQLDEQRRRVDLPMLQGNAAHAHASELAVCDWVMTELDDEFVVRAISEAGRELVAQLALPPAHKAACEEAAGRVADAAHRMGRSIARQGIQKLLYDLQEHPRWDDVAARCLGCGNCTLVCPTCFCSCVEDHTDLRGDCVERVRRWDSCFNPDFARVHAGNYRASLRARYRHWLTHKFASWLDQFDVSGCVGCGRCITWCPVGIDVTEELAALRSSYQSDQGSVP